MIPSSVLSISYDSGGKVSTSYDSGGMKPRDCLLRAILSLLTSGPEEKNLVSFSINGNMPEEGDTSIAAANTGLSAHGLKLESVNEKYMVKGGIMYNLLQKVTCKLVIKICLTSHKKTESDAHHFIGFDGNTLYDFPQSAKLIRHDRENKKSCRAVFEALYPFDDYSGFEITNVYELRLTEL